MTETLKVLGQAAPSATTLTDIYTVPSNTSAVISAFTVANQNATQIKYRVAIAVVGASNTAKQYIAYDIVLPANTADCVDLPKGVSLSATDVVRVYSDTANVSFNVFGVEVT